MNRRIFFLLLIVLLGCVSAVKYPEGNSSVPVDSLYRSYRDYFPIGAAINPEADLASEERKAFIARHYNSVTPENQMKLKFIHPKEDKWNWEPADRIVAFAKANNMKVRGHVLVWYQNLPLWYTTDGDKLCSKEQLYKRMKNHIEDMMGRYKNDVYCWDVVNEAISDNPAEVFRAKDTLFQIAGEEYVEMAFRFARQAAPSAQLYYNDYRFSNPDKRKKIYDLLKRLKEKGVPVDGVGMQSHYTPNEVSEEYLQETIDMFSEIGLKVQITELDVSVYNYRDKDGPDADKTDHAYTEERKKIQEEMYKMLFRVYRRNKAAVTGVTFWGTSDMRKNYRTNRIGKMDYPFLFDENMRTKKVFYEVVRF